VGEKKTFASFTIWQKQKSKISKIFSSKAILKSLTWWPKH
jgi:hypothetical protein